MARHRKNPTRRTWALLGGGLGLGILLLAGLLWSRKAKAAPQLTETEEGLVASSNGGGIVIETRTSSRGTVYKLVPLSKKQEERMSLLWQKSMLPHKKLTTAEADELEILKARYDRFKNMVRAVKKQYCAAGGVSC